jgi:hypothetical protein
MKLSKSYARKLSTPGAERDRHLIDQLLSLTTPLVHAEQLRNATKFVSQDLKTHCDTYDWRTFVF